MNTGFERHLPGRRPAGVCALAAALALAGCGSLAPRYERPAAPVPTALPGAGSASDADARPADTQPILWTEFVRDPMLRSLVERALANNRDLRVAMLNVQRAQAQWRVTQADRWPTVGAGVTFARQPSVVNGQETNTYAAGVQVSNWELDFFGRLASLSDAARAQLLASEAGRRSAELSLVATVLATALNVSADVEQVALAQRTLDSRQESLRLTQLKYDVGAASELDRQTTVSLVAQAAASLAQQQRLRAQDLNALALVVGEPVAADAVPAVAGWIDEPAVNAPGAPGAPAPRSAASSVAAAADQPAAAGLLAEVPVGVSSQVLLRRPDVIQAEASLMAANANIGAARAAFWPRITLTASAGQASSDLSGLFEAGHFAWTLSSQAILTIFDYGRNKANLEASKVSRDIAVAQYEKAVQSAFRDTADALVGLATWRDQLAAQRSQLAAARDIARLTQLRWQNGAASELERLDAERSRYAAEQAAIQARLAELQTRVSLYKALGT